MQDIQNTRKEAPVKEAPFLGLTGMGGGAASLGLVGQAVVTGQQTYATAGTYSWTAPDGVESISIVCIGGGGGGNIGRTAGSGGGCAYKNNYTVVPGNSYTVVVGSAVVGSAVVFAIADDHGRINNLCPSLFFAAAGTG